MNPTENKILEAAALWAARSSCPDFADWGGLTLWLELDPRHASAYDEALSAGDAFKELAEQATKIIPTPANDEPMVGQSRRGFWGGAIAAALALTVGISVWTQLSNPYVVRTKPGETRLVTLADGSSITLNGATILNLDANNPRFASLTQGEAYFHVRHDNQDPFIVQSGEVTLIDAGTAFNVVSDHSRFEVSVSEGMVIYNPDAERVELAAGRRLIMRQSSDILELSNTPITEVASWRSGRLIFEDESIADVGAALNRGLGIKLIIDPRLSQRRFSGVLQIDRAEPESIETHAKVMGLSARRTDNGWVLEDRDASS